MTEQAKMVAPKPGKKVELRFGREGFQSPEDPRKVRARTSFDRGRQRRVPRPTMSARWMRIETDGTLEGTRVYVKDASGQIVKVGGLTYLELVAEQGKPRLGAIMTLKMQNADIPEYAESAGEPVMHGGEVVVEDGKPKQVGGIHQQITADVFAR